MKYGCQSMVGKIESIMIRRPVDAFCNQDNLNRTWEDYGYFGCPDYEKVLSEYEEFETFLQKNVENIYYAPSGMDIGLDSIYTHDPQKITEKGAIYFPMGKELRSKEWITNKAFLESIGVPTLGVIEPPGKMEGGDIVWLDEKTVAIGRGYRTNDEGIRQFKALTSDFIDEYLIVPMPHGEGEEACLHLMSIISMVDYDKAVVYSKFMPVFFRELLIERGISLIECNDEEYDYLGSNVLAVAPGKVITIAGNKDIVTKMRNAGIDVTTYEGHELSYKGTGGPTCLTCPITRYKI